MVEPPEKKPRTADHDESRSPTGYQPIGPGPSKDQFVEFRPHKLEAATGSWAELQATNSLSSYFPGKLCVWQDPL